MAVCLKAERLGVGPLVTPETDARIGPNINGPSLIRVPDWVPRRLGHYYLYLAAHRGASIRLAYSNSLCGPWRIYGPGVLSLADSMFVDHIASPDVHVDPAAHEILMYYHGMLEDGSQATRLAVSPDGLRFRPLPEILGPWYFRAFTYAGWWYAVAMPGTLYRSPTGRVPFERGCPILPASTRHVAVWTDEATLHVVFSCVGECPESLLATSVALGRDWQAWRASEPRLLLAPDMPYEGGDLPLVPSVRGEAPGPCRQLRDPAVYGEGDDRYLLYCVAGESGIAIARLLTVRECAPDDNNNQHSGTDRCGSHPAAGR